MEPTEVVNTLWDRINECLADENGLSCMRRLARNASMLSAYMESFGILSEARTALYALKSKNKKISMGSHSRTVDTCVHILEDADDFANKNQSISSWHH